MTAPSPALTRSERNLGLDVVRATAILMVVGCHYGNAILANMGVPNPAIYPAPAGWFGVELFFVLSGFLIGRILFRLAETTPRPGALLVFLTRRWMRTLPLYFAWICLLWLFLPYDRKSAYQVMQYLTLTQNLYWPMPLDNWFAVSWSLTVEEWFYLLFGTCVILCAAVLPRRLAVWLPVALFIVVPTYLRCTLPTTDPLFADIRRVALLRLDAIAYGAAMAAISMYRPAWLKHPIPLLAVGLLLVVLAWLRASAWLVPWHMAGSLMLSMGSLGLVLCLPAAVNLTRAPRWLEGMIRTISAQSYGLYIMHLTFLDLAFWFRGSRPWLSWQVAIFTALALSFALSWLSFRYFESPILSRRPTQGRAARRDAPGQIGALTATAAVGARDAAD